MQALSMPHLARTPDRSSSLAGVSSPQHPVGRIEQVPLREVWAHEAHSLTPWLLDNADLLAEALGIDLELTANEHAVGKFSLDLIGRDLTNDCVLIVENQLTPSDHDHLGKLITYTAGTDAKTVVWLAPSFRDEHRQALELLNDLGGDQVRFFAIELAAIRIGDSAVAPLLESRVEPSDWHSQLSSYARGVSKATGKPAMYQEFWGALLARMGDEHPHWSSARTPGTSNWIALPCPFKGGSKYGMVFAQHGQLRFELYIDANDPALVEDLYQQLLQHREALESAFGGPLSWEALDGRRASRISVYTDGDVTNSDEHARYIDWFLETGERFRRAVESVAPEVSWRA
jgi:hypothetical protein